MFPIHSAQTMTVPTASDAASISSRLNETGPPVCVTVVGTGILSEALASALQGRCWQNRSILSILCTQTPPPLHKRSLDVQMPEGPLSHDIPVEVLLVVSLGMRRMKILLESPEVTELRQGNQCNRIGTRIVLMCSGPKDLSQYPRWVGECDPFCLDLESDVEALLDAVLVAAGRNSAPCWLSSTPLTPPPLRQAKGSHAERGRKNGSVSGVIDERATLSPPAKLSEREKELARLAASGHSNAEIAHQLSLSTVKWHLQRVFTKLKIERRSQLAHQGILP